MICYVMNYHVRGCERDVGLISYPDLSGAHDELTLVIP